jgi:hypothetical protein
MSIQREQADCVAAAACSVLVLLEVLGVCLLVHELFDILGVLDADLEDPTVILGLGVDDGGITLDVLVVGKDLTGHGGIDIGGGLHRLNTADTVSLGEAGADLSDLQVNNISKLTLGKVCDANLSLL